MSVFKFESMPPFLGSEVKGEAIGLLAMHLDDDPKRQALAREFMLYVGHDFVTVESSRSDGRLIYVRLYFDGERFTLSEQGVTLKRSLV